MGEEVKRDRGGHELSSKGERLDVPPSTASLTDCMTTSIMRY